MNGLLSHIPALADVSIPPQVDVKTVPNLENLLTEIGRRSMMGYSGDVFFGQAFLQGNRLQFTTAMPVQKMIDVSETDRSLKGATVAEAQSHSNRPQEPGHAKQIQRYLEVTACVGEKFILPAFTFNYGVGLGADAPVATLTMLGGAPDGTNAWPAILTLPAGAKLDTTDGAHRRKQIEVILASSRIEDDKKVALRRNSVDVKIIFESSKADSHQDFADCAKAKALPRSLVTTFDVRDLRNKASRDLVSNHAFLAHYVDATASNVNLSAKSRKIWSLSAIRGFVGHINDHHPDAEHEVTEKIAAAPEFFNALVRELPQLRALEMARLDPSSAITTASLREKRGGDLALRGVGMALFARAFLACHTESIPFDVMAERLATIDWHLLDCERDKIEPTATQTYQQILLQHIRPIWAPLLVLSETRYRISASAGGADSAWANIVNLYLEDLFPKPEAA
jgi:DGQHR domain-containing protein